MDVTGSSLTEWEWVFCWFPKTTRVGGRTHAFTSLQRRKVADRVSLDGIVLTARWEYKLRQPDHAWRAYPWVVGF
jgi:hypothetical protein